MFWVALILQSTEMSLERVQAALKYTAKSEKEEYNDADPPA